MDRRRGIMLVVLVALAAGAYYAYREYNRTNIGLEQVSADAQVSAMALINEFLANDSIANNKYRNKILAVEGWVKAVDTVGGGCTVVMGDTPELSSAVRCLLDSAQVSAAGAIRRGDIITVKGAITGFKKDETGLLGSDVELTRCVLANHQ